MRLVEWYSLNRRDLPWRRTADPYAVWVSEIMLQQTRIETVIPYYLAFLTRFPAVSDLADASLDEVLKSWENLGYYSRARNLHRAARIVVEKHGGRIPGEEKALRSLPGIGRYTAGAILSIAFGKRIPALDGNAERVLARIFAGEIPVGSPEGKRKLEGVGGELVPRKEPGSFNQALMELGALVCLPRKPLCPSCPVGDRCEGRRRGMAESLPVKRKKPSIPRKVAVAALLRNVEGRYFVLRRSEKGLLPGLWAFPSAEWSGDSPDEWLEGQAGGKILEVHALSPVRHAYTHFRVTVHPYLCLLSGASGNGNGESGRWLHPDEFGNFALSALDRRLLLQILRYEDRHASSGIRGAGK
jgi:A/G-specific adenine glycosylase